MSTKSTNLNESQLLGARLLAAGESGKVVAEKLNVAPETISRWRKQPEFEAYLNDFLLDAHEATKNRLRGVATQALDVVETLMQDSQVPARDRLSTALKILKMIGACHEKIGPTDAEQVVQYRTFEEVAVAKASGCF